MVLYAWDGGEVTPEELWDKFIEHLNTAHALRSGLPHKAFCGSIESYKRIFIEANKE